MFNTGADLTMTGAELTNLKVPIWVSADSIM
jgi:hypothetical protein